MATSKAGDLKDDCGAGFLLRMLLKNIGAR